MAIDHTELKMRVRKLEKELHDCQEIDKAVREDNVQLLHDRRELSAALAEERALTDELAKAAHDVGLTTQELEQALERWRAARGQSEVGT